MPEMPGSWERMLKEAIGSGERGILEVPGGASEMDWGKGLKNLGRAWLEQQVPGMKEQKTYGSLEETLAALESGEIPTYEAMLRLDAVKALGTGAKAMLRGAKVLGDPMTEAQMRTAISQVIQESRKIPQSAWDTVKEVRWQRLPGKTMGEYTEEFAGPGREVGRVKFDPIKAEKTTPWHEVAGHGRFFAPGEATIAYHGEPVPEEELAAYAKDISWLLRGKGNRAQYEKGWYSEDPMETSAEALARKMVSEGSGERYEELYPKILGRAIEVFESKFPKESMQATFKSMARGAD